MSPTKLICYSSNLTTAEYAKLKDYFNLKGVGNLEKIKGTSYITLSSLRCLVSLNTLNSAKLIPLGYLHRDKYLVKYSAEYGAISIKNLKSNFILRSLLRSYSFVNYPRNLLVNTIKIISIIKNANHIAID